MYYMVQSYPLTLPLESVSRYSVHMEKVKNRLGQY